MEATLRAFMSKETVRVLLPTQQTAYAYARLHFQLRTAGTPIPIGDLWIAAQVLEEDIPLITRDTHFRRLPQLRIREETD